MNDNRYLMHHGVKGMRWGVRKDKPSVGASLRARAQTARANKIERKRAKAMDRSTSARYTYRQRKHLSDDELRARINRLNMEKQLKDLSKGRSSGPEFIMLDNGQRAARQALGKYGAKVALNAVGLGGAADFIRPKK